METDTNADEMLKRSMLGGTELIKRFFREVRGYVRRDGIIIMPYFHFAGPENNPETHAREYSLNVKEHKIESIEGLQQGDFSIYVMTR